MATLPPSPDDDPHGHVPKKRPAAVETLGLALPVTEEDVRQAYRQQAQKAHPDHGGSAEKFIEVQRAFDEALEFAKRNGKRLPWIGAQMPIYVAQIEAIERVEQWGGTVETESLDWLEGTVGDDFAHLADRLKGVDLSGCRIGDTQLLELISDTAHLPFLEVLSLADTDVSDRSVERLTELLNLKRLNLRGTKVSYGLRRQLAYHRGMEQVEGQSRLGEWLHRFGRR